MKRHEDSQKNLAIRGVRAVTKTASAAAAEVLDNLDGVAKMARVDLSKAAVKRTVAEAGRLAGRVKEEGVVQVIQSSGMVRKWRYGLEDDEDSIFGIDELKELGDAEMALLDALGEANKSALEYNQEGEPSSEANSSAEPPLRGGEASASSPSPPGGEAGRLQALSKRLDQRRQERRRVKML
ncbi:unnamed protein product [Polarella glacialis]|nr:unnamed protein product [Polarella glacialis]